MKIVTMRIADLVPAPYNPRVELKPGDPEYEKLKRSIQEFGLVDPIIYNECTGYVVGGHQRLSVLADLEITEVQVSVVDLPEEKEKALNLALNKITGAWDMPKLHDLLGDLNSLGADMDCTGFDVVEIDKILKQFDVPNIDFPEYDESVEKDVKKVVCPNCGEEIPV